MKYMLSVVLLLVLAACASAQGYQYTIQGDAGCETQVTILAASQPLNVTLDGIGPIVVEPFAKFESRLPASNQAFTLLVESYDSNYMIDTALECPPEMIDAYAALEAAMFKRMGWGPDDIDWFRNVYTPLFGNPREYILGVAEGYKALDVHLEIMQPEISIPPVEPLEPTPEATQTN